MLKYKIGDLVTINGKYTPSGGDEAHYITEIMPNGTNDGYYYCASLGQTIIQQNGICDMTIIGLVVQPSFKPMIKKGDSFQPKIDYLPYFTKGHTYKALNDSQLLPTHSSETVDAVDNNGKISLIYVNEIASGSSFTPTFLKGDVIEALISVPTLYVQGAHYDVLKDSYIYNGVEVIDLSTGRMSTLNCKLVSRASTSGSQISTRGSSFTPTFLKGDKVICINVGPNCYITKNKQYIVESNEFVINRTHCIEIQTDDGKLGIYAAVLFQRVEPPTAQPRAAMHVCMHIQPIVNKLSGRIDNETTMIESGFQFNHYVCKYCDRDMDQIFGSSKKSKHFSFGW